MNVPVINIENKIPNQKSIHKIIYKINKIEDENDEFPNYQILQKNYLKALNSKSQNYQLNKSNNSYQIKMKSYENKINNKNKSQNFNYNLNNNIQFNNKYVKVNNISTGKKREPKDSISKSKRSSQRIENNEGSLSYRLQSSKKEIPKIVSLKKNSFSGKENLNTNIYIQKEACSELVDIPRSEYGSYAGKDILFVGGGMQTGEYKFKGSKILMKVNENEKQKITLDEEEIFKEINKRKNKTKKIKKAKYEIIDKFYTTTEFDGKPITKVTRKKENQVVYEEDNMKNKLFALQNNKDRNKSYDCKFEEIKNKEEKQEWKKIKNFKISKYNNYTENFRYKINNTLYPKDNFSKCLFELINKVRADPQSYISVIEEAKNYIIRDNYGRLIYNGKVKVSLSRGVNAFNDAINYLKDVEYMEKLQYNESITIPSPQNENEITDVNYMNYKMQNIIYNSGIAIKSYWREIIYEPEVCFLLMIIDDNGSKSGMRRNDILNPNIKYIGISSNQISRFFACFITLGI